MDRSRCCVCVSLKMVPHACSFAHAQIQPHAQSVTSGIIVPLGDLSAQAIEQYKARKALVAAGRDPEAELQGIDWARVVRFIIFGGTLQGPWNQ